MITTIDEVYAFVELAMQRCREHGHDDIAQQLDDALQLGSSGMEILGATKDVFIAYATRLEQVVEKAKIEDVIKCVDKSFGLK